PSDTCSDFGTCHESTMERSDRRTSIKEVANVSDDPHWPALPVEMYTVPLSMSTAGELHTDAPMQPDGTRYSVPVTAPVVADSLTSAPRTSGQSASDASPM